MAIALRRSTVSAATLLAAISVLDRGVPERGRGPSPIKEVLKQFNQGDSLYIFSSVSMLDSSAPNEKGEAASASWKEQNQYWNSVKSNNEVEDKRTGQKTRPAFGLNDGGIPVSFSAKPFRIAPSLDVLLSWYDGGVNFWDDANNVLMSREDIIARVEGEELDCRGCMIVRTDLDVPQLSQAGTDQTEESTTADAVTESGIPTV